MRSRSSRPSARACRSIATNGTTPEPPATSSAGRLAVPDEPAADRAAHLELVAGLDDVGQERRHLAVVEPLDAQLDQRVRRAPRPPSTTAARCSRPRRSAGPRSAARAGGRSGRARRAAARPSAGSGGARPRPSPSRQPPARAPARRPASERVAASQSPWYRCSTPRVAAVVVAVALPEARWSWSSRVSRVTHFALFQKYRCGTSSRTGPPCSRAAAGPRASTPPTPCRR